MFWIGNRRIANVMVLAPLVALSFLSPASSAGGTSESPSLYSSDDNSSVKLITSQIQFQEHILQSDEIWLVQFFEHGSKNCEAFATPYKETGEVLKGIVRVAAIDVSDAESEFTKIMKSGYKWKSLPTLYIFSSDKKQAPSLIKGKHNIQDIVQEVLNNIVNTLQMRATSIMGSKNNQNNFDSSSDANKLVQLNQSNFQSMVLDDKKNIWMVAFIAPWYV